MSSRARVDKRFKLPALPSIPGFNVARRRSTHMVLPTYTMPDGSTTRPVRHRQLQKVINRKSKDRNRAPKELMNNLIATGLVKTSLSPQELTELSRIFFRLSDGDNRLRTDAVSFEFGLTGPETFLLFGKDEHIDIVKFVRGIQKWKVAAMSGVKHRYKTLFKLLDRDGDGNVSLDEFLNFMRGIQELIDDKFIVDYNEIHEYVERVDPRNSGVIKVEDITNLGVDPSIFDRDENGDVTVDEFMGTALETQAGGMFSKMDLDGNGEISQREFMKKGSKMFNHRDTTVTEITDMLSRGYQKNVIGRTRLPKI